jgi:hypothetical protein
MFDADAEEAKSMPEVPSLFIYEYPSLAGPPLGTYEPDLAALDAAAAEQLLALWVGILAAPQEDGSLLTVGNVFRYASRDAPGALHVLARWADESICLQRDEIATQLLRDGTYFRECHAAEPWIPFTDVLLWFQYEFDYGLVFLADRLSRAFLSPREQSHVFMLCQMLYTAIERNHLRERQAARRAFRKALPALLPGLQVAKKKPGYGWNKGQAHFFLTQHDHLFPTQFRLSPVSRHCVETLRQAIQAYKSQRGYFVAPRLDADVVLDDNMVFVPFGGSRTETDGSPNTSNPLA